MAVSAVKKEPAKPKQAEPAPGAEAAPTPAPAGKNRKKLLFIAVALAVLAGASGGAWWYMHRAAGPQTSKVEPAKPPVFAPLDAFTVNLQPEDGQQFAQVGLTLRMTDEAAVAALKLHMPEVRDRILLMLSAKKGSELISLEGKKKLVAEIQAAVNEILVPGSTKPAQIVVKPAAQAAAPAAAAEAAQQGERDGAAQGEPAAEAQEPAAAEPAPAPAETAAPAAPVLPVTGVLFTSFIIQ